MKIKKAIERMGKMRKNGSGAVLIGICITAGMVVLLGCDIIGAPPPQEPVTLDPALPIIIPKVNSASLYSGSPVQKITFTPSESEKQMTFTGVQDHSLFLIKVNRSSRTAAYAQTGHGYPQAWDASRSRTGFSQAAMPALPPRVFQGSGRFAAGDTTLTRYDHPGAQAFNRNPPPFTALPGQAPRETRSGSLSSPAFTAAAMGTRRNFWVEDRNGTWQSISAVLQALSAHSKVWIAEANYSVSAQGSDNKLTQTQAQQIAAQFDAIYTYETPIFGYEYGGGVTADQEVYGGVDGDPAVQILVYDIDYDYAPSQTSGVFGFFWAKDWYTQAAIDQSQSSIKTNQAELFYIDAFFADGYPDAIYSTLAHEFQHMINFNGKTIKNNQTSETWYDEMLSLLAEDLIAPLIGIPISNAGHPIASRIPLFLDAYNYASLTEWFSDDRVFISYANVFAFGAYLSRNYGGVELLKAIAGNNTTNIRSLSAALGKLNGGISFDTALSRYGEAFVYSGAHKPAGIFSFDKTISTQINNTNYTFNEFDLWTIADDAQGYANIPSNYRGPLVWDVEYQFEMPGYSVIVQSTDVWQQAQDQEVTVTFWKPSQENIDLYMMIR